VSGVICHQGVSDGSDGARPLRLSHSAWTEIFFADAALRIELDISHAVAALFLSQCLAIHQPHDRGKESPSVSQISIHFRLHFNGNGIGIDINITISIGNSLAGYSESNWAIDSGDRKSQKGHVLLATNGAILWQSRQHSVIAMSTPIQVHCLLRPLEIRNGYFY